MKVIHTSDWHLGRAFGPLSMRGDQEAFCDWFVDFVRDERAELVVIAGDIYDRAVAPTESIGLFRDTIGRLLATGCVVAAITGNHDSADRAAPYSELLDLSRFYLRGGYDRIGEVITHDFDDGPLDLILLPYLDPCAAPDDFGVDPDTPLETMARDAGATSDVIPDDASGTVSDDASDEASGTVSHQNSDDLLERRRTRDHQSVLADAIRHAHAGRCSERSIALSHAFVIGGESSESEKALTIGGTGAVDASIFDGFSYVALGHLHRPQTIGGDERIRYSGTPLAYSFSEDHEKSVTIIDLDPRGNTTVRIQTVPAGHAVATIRGSMAELLDPNAHPEAHDAYTRAQITDRETVLDAKTRLATIYPHIVEVQLHPGGELPKAASDAIAVDRFTPLDAVRMFWGVAEGSPPTSQVDELLVAATADATRVAG